MLVAVMMAMGCSLTKDDSKRVLSNSSTDSEDEHDLNSNSNNNLTAIPAGVSCQYIVSTFGTYSCETLSA